MDLDQSGNSEQVVRVNLGPTLGWVNVRVNPSQSISSAGTYIVAPGTGVVMVDSIGPVTINLPDVTKWVQESAYMPATGFERAIVIKDLGGNAAMANITVTPVAGQFIDKTFTSFIMSTAKQVLCLLPLRDMSGWYNVSSGTGGGGGGGGGSSTVGDVALFATPASAQAAVIGGNIGSVSVEGNSAPADGGAGVYGRVNSLPSAYVGDGSTTPLIPPSFTSGGVPTLCFATTTTNQNNIGPTTASINAGCLTILAVFDMRGTPVPSTITDSVGNVYNLAVQAVGGSFPPTDNVAIYYNVNPVFAPIGTTFGFATGPRNVRVYCFTTFKGAVLDQTAIQNTPAAITGSSITSSTLTGAPELIFAMTFTGGSPIFTEPGTAYVVPAGWLDIEPPLNFRNPVACTVVNSASPVTFNPTWPAVGGFTATSILVTFKTFPQTSLSASFWQLIPSVPLHTRHFGIDPKAPDNAASFQSFSNYLATTAVPSGGQGAERAPTPNPATVTISIASPAVITVAFTGYFSSHGLRNGQMISFQTTGQLPAGIVANQIYYVLYGTVTPLTFQITSTPLFNGTLQISPKGTAISTTGTQSGTHSYTTYGENWTDFIWDPGSYVANHNMAPGINCGLKKTRILAYGARIASNINFYGWSDNDVNANTGGTTTAYHTQFKTTDDVDVSGHSPNSVTLITPGQAVNFYVNSWVALMGIDMMHNAGGNFNPSTFEFLQIKSVDPVGGVITFYDALQYNYRSTYPKFTLDAGAGNWSGSIDGPGTIQQMSDVFDQELEVRGLNIYGVTEGTVGGMRTIRLIDCEIYGWAFDSGPSPVNIRKFTMERCTFHNCVPEVDKMIDTIEYIDCVFDQTSYPHIQSASINKMIIDRCKMMSNVTGTAKDTTIRDSFVTGKLIFGPVYGTTDRVTLINSYISETADSQQEGTVIGTTAVTFTNGTLSIPIGSGTVYGTWLAPGGAIGAGCPLPWAVPGAKIALCSFCTNVGAGATINANSTIGMMKAFTVLDVYVDGAGAFSVDTDLPAFPNTAITLTGTVSGTTLTATAVAPVDAWPLAGMLITGGTLPAGTTIIGSPGLPGNQLGAYTLNNSATIGASTPFTVTNNMYYQPHSCPRLTVINCTGGRTVADMAGAPPDIPMYSYFKRAYAGTPFAGILTNERYVRLAGNLLYLNINVLRPYTGAAATFVLTLDLFGYKTSGGITYPTTLRQTVNLKTVGLRQISATGITGNLTGDTIVAVPFWLTGSHVVGTGPAIGGGDTLAMMPYVVVTAQADQGIYPSMTLAAHSGIDQFADTVTRASALW